MKNYFWARDGKEKCEWVRASDVVVGALSEVPRPLVHVNGVFDLLHASHMRLLDAARRGGGRKGEADYVKTATLVATMDSDRMVRQKKGEGRPICSFVERASCLSHWVDYLIEIDSDQEYKEVVLALSPDLLVTGGDKVPFPDAFPQFRSMVVRDHGLRTSEIILRCQGVV